MVMMSKICMNQLNVKLSISNYTMLINIAHWYTPNCQNSLPTPCICIGCRSCWPLRIDMLQPKFDIWVLLKFFNHELDIGLVDLGHHDHLPTQPTQSSKRASFKSLGCMVDTCNVFSNHLPLKLQVEDDAFCANLQWSLQPHTQEKAHLQVML